MDREEVLAFLRTVTEESEDFSTAFFVNRREVMFELRGSSENGRRAAVRTPGSRWFSVEVEELFDHTFVDEDADDDEIRGYLIECVRVAQAYVRSGAREERRGFLRWRSIVVDVDGSPFRLEKIVGRRS